MPPRAPTRDEWTGLGVHDVAELGGGRQSQVFAARCAGESVAVKLTQARLVDGDVLAHAQGDVDR